MSGDVVFIFLRHYMNCLTAIIIIIIIITITIIIKGKTYRTA